MLAGDAVLSGLRVMEIVQIHPRKAFYITFSQHTKREKPCCHLVFSIFDSPQNSVQAEPKFGVSQVQSSVIVGQSYPKLNVKYLES
jgi:hypothetical protein